MKRLKHLSASNNSIAQLNQNVLDGLTHLESVDLSYNKFATISEELRIALKIVDSIDLRHNQIFSVSSSEVVTAWRHLNVAGNLIKLLTGNALNNLLELKTLNLSHNALMDIDNGAFKSLTSLKVLDLSSNELPNLALNLPDTVQDVLLGNNSLHRWPLENTPRDLLHLDVHGNELVELFPGHETVSNLKVS